MPLPQCRNEQTLRFEDDYHELLATHLSRKGRGCKTWIDRQIVHLLVDAGVLAASYGWVYGYVLNHSTK